MKDRCPACDGGKKTPQGQPCPICKATGEIRVPDTSIGEHYGRCLECYGVKVVLSYDICHACDAKLSAMARESDGEDEVPKNI